MLDLTGIGMWLKDWGPVISGLGSLALTGGLVYLYSRQTSIQESQQDLLRRELNREVRQGHTDTLRKRIRAWHGDMDEIGVSEEAFFSDETNLPKVKGASVEPAPALITVAGEEPEFRVIPEAIEHDRYLHDLLENHAPDLKEAKQEIENQYERFSDARDAFISEYSDAPVIENDQYAIRPMDHYPRWVFERAVLFHRKQRDVDKDRLRNIIESHIGNSSSVNVDTATKFFSGLEGPGTYEATIKSGDFDEYGLYEDEIEEQVVNIHFDAIDEIGDDGIYAHAVEAARVLDEMSQSVEELKAKLVEHEGHPVYLDDCPYLEDELL